MVRVDCMASLHVGGLPILSHYVQHVLPSSAFLPGVFPPLFLLRHLAPSPTDGYDVTAVCCTALVRSPSAPDDISYFFRFKCGNAAASRTDDSATWPAAGCGSWSVTACVGRLPGSAMSRFHRNRLPSQMWQALAETETFSSARALANPVPPSSYDTRFLRRVQYAVVVYLIARLSASEQFDEFTYRPLADLKETVSRRTRSDPSKRNWSGARP